MFICKYGYFLVIISIFVWHYVFRRQLFNASWAALCAKQAQHLIHFVPKQGPFFFSHHPFSKRVRHFGTYFLPLCIKRPLNFYVMQHIFGQKRHFML